jgi:hypothetical protein
MTTSRTLAASALLLAITGLGCAAGGPPFHAVSARADQAVIYVYRPSTDAMGSGMALDMSCDGQKFGSLRWSGYVAVVVMPGAHHISCQIESPAEVNFVAEAGKSYYIQADLQGGIILYRPQLTMVPEENGKLAILSERESIN